MMDISCLDGEKLKIIPVHIKNILWLILRLYLRNKCLILTYMEYFNNKR